jgi:hypothetical protein
MGNIAKTLIKEGSMGISSRGLGTVGDDGYVNEDYNLICWDLVTDPSNNPSWVNGIYEGRTWEIEIPDRPLTEQEQLIEAQEHLQSHLWQVIEKIEKSL